MIARARAARGPEAAAAAARSAAARAPAAAPAVPGHRQGPPEDRAEADAVRAAAAPGRRVRDDLARRSSSGRTRARPRWTTRSRSFPRGTRCWPPRSPRAGPIGGPLAPSAPPPPPAWRTASAARACGAAAADPPAAWEPPRRRRLPVQEAAAAASASGARARAGARAASPCAPTGRALADLYFAQGHYAEALQIYDDLVAAAPLRRRAEADAAGRGGAPSSRRRRRPRWPRHGRRARAPPGPDPRPEAAGSPSSRPGDPEARGRDIIGDAHERLSGHPAPDRRARRGNAGRLAGRASTASRSTPTSARKACRWTRWRPSSARSSRPRTSAGPWPITAASASSRSRRDGPTAILSRVTEEYYLLLLLARDGNFGRGRFELRKAAAVAGEGAACSRCFRSRKSGS